MQQSKITKNISIAQSFDDLKVCVIIPTYNNAATIKQVIESVLAFTDNVIVVNDGSTDDTANILSGVLNIQKVAYEKNRGKGWALRQGFKKAIELGYLFAITIDSDGQHFAKDLPVFITKLQAEGSALIMGARNMATAENVPGKSSFGNKFSNFWYKVETGIDLPDTQTGYRLYPLAPLRKMKFFTKKYEFEIEVIVRLAWAGAKVVSVPITVYYPPKNERISHFRPFKDFTRISVVNTVLVALLLLYIKPRDFFRWLFKKKDWRTELKNILLKPGESDFKKANAIAFGGFMGIIPIWGFQLLVGIAISHLLKLNKALFVIAAHISIAPMIPLIIFLSFLMGKPFMDDRAVSLNFNTNISLQQIGINLEQYLYGSIALAILVAVLFWLSSYLFLKIYRRAKPSRGGAKS